MDEDIPKRDKHPESAKSKTTPHVTSSPMNTTMSAEAKALILHMLQISGTCGITHSSATIGGNTARRTIPGPKYHMTGHLLVPPLFPPSYVDALICVHQVASIHASPQSCPATNVFQTGPTPEPSPVVQPQPKDNLTEDKTECPFLWFKAPSEALCHQPSNTKA